MTTPAVSFGTYRWLVIFLKSIVINLNDSLIKDLSDIFLEGLVHWLAAVRYRLNFIDLTGKPTVYDKKGTFIKSNSPFRVKFGISTVIFSRWESQLNENRPFFLLFIKNVWKEVSAQSETVWKSCSFGALFSFVSVPLWTYLLYLVIYIKDFIFLN